MQSNETIRVPGAAGACAEVLSIRAQRAHSCHGCTLAKMMTLDEKTLGEKDL